MSLPSVGKGSALIHVDPKKQQAMDAPLMALAEMSGGDLRQLLFAFFSFLNRRTDFYVLPNNEDLKAGLPVKMGFREGDAEKLLIAAFRQFPLRRAPPSQKETPASASSPVPSAAARDQSPKEKEITIETTEQLANEAPAESVSSKEVIGTSDGAIRYTDDGKQIPEGNGGSTKEYKWTQTLDETSVLIGVPEGTKGKDLSVSLKASSISVRMKRSLDGEDSPRVLVEGDLVGKIRTDESIWSLEGGVLILTLDKLKKTWWETVVVGDEVIDTSLVDSTRNIDTYDETTQAAIRRIIFDQRQERLGLPKSNEILGGTPDIPELPSDIEYIDKSTLDWHSTERKSSEQERMLQLNKH